MAKRLELTRGEQIVVECSDTRLLVGEKPGKPGTLVLTNKRIFFLRKGAFGKSKEILRQSLGDIRITANAPGFYWEEQPDKSSLKVTVVLKRGSLTFLTKNRNDAYAFCQNANRLAWDFQASKASRFSFRPSKKMAGIAAAAIVLVLIGGIFGSNTRDNAASVYRSSDASRAEIADPAAEDQEAEAFEALQTWEVPQESPPVIDVPQETDPNAAIQVWVSDDGHRYHRKSTCSNMKNNVRLVTIQDAKGMGRTACGRCKPPQ